MGGVLPVIVEKDFGVCWALDHLFPADHGPHDLFELLDADVALREACDDLELGVRLTIIVAEFHLIGTVEDL